MTRGRAALVTGGAGFIGSHIVERLVGDGWSIRVLDDFSTGREENLETCLDRIEMIRGNFCDAPTLERAADGAEVIFHQAAIPSVPQSVSDPTRTNAVNLSGSVAVFEVARRRGVGRVVYAASSAAYGDEERQPLVERLPARPLSPYALQKHASEIYARLFHQLYGLETVCLRYFNVFGPRQDPESDYAAVIPLFISAALDDEAVRIFGDGEQTRDFVFVADVVEANLRAASAEGASGSVLNVASGRRTSLNELVDRIGECVGHEVPRSHEPPRPGDVLHSWADISQAQELLGYRPRVDLKEGLRLTVEFFARAGSRQEAAG